MDKYQFIVDDTIISNPDQWQQMELTAERDKEISGILTLFTSELTFRKDGYTLLKQRFDDNYNTFVSAIVNRLTGGVYITAIEGIILLSDIVFNLEKKTATVTVEDGSFQGGVSNYKNDKSFLNGGFTRNGVPITSPTPVILDFFTPATGVYKGWGDRDCYLVSDALDFMVRFMTDDRVKGIRSDYLSDTSNFEGFLPYVVTGEEIRTGTADAPNIKFADIMEFLKRTHDLTFSFQNNSDGEPVMQIEGKETFFDDTVAATIRKIKDLTLEVDTEKLFSRLLIGNNTFTESGNCSPTTRFFAFRNEDYVIQGKANKDQALDLRTDYVTDSNTIEDIVVNNEDSFDENIFIIVGDSATNKAVQFQDTSYCSNLFFYNQGFTNDQIVQRYINSIPGNTAKFLVTDSTTANIGLSGGIRPIFPPFNYQRFSFNNETSPFFDTGTNYNNTPGNFYYDIPFAANYSFEYNVKLEFSRALGSLCFEDAFTTITMRLQKMDSNFNVLEEKVKQLAFKQFAGKITLLDGTKIIFPSEPPVFRNIFDSTTFSCSAGQRIAIKTEILWIPGATNCQGMIINILPDNDTFFSCLGADEDAGVYKIFQPTEYRVLLYNFAKNQSFTEAMNLFNNRIDQVAINEGSDPSNDKATWIQRMSHKIETGETQFTQIN